MTKMDFRQRISALSQTQLKYIYVHLLEILDPEMGLIITPDEIKNKETEDYLFMQAFFSQIDIPEEELNEFQNPAVDFLIKIAEEFPDYKNQIESMIDETCTENLTLSSLQETSTILTPIIIATAVALIKPKLKIISRSEKKKNDYLKTSEFEVDFEVKGIKNIVDVVKGLFSTIKNP